MTNLVLQRELIRNDTARGHSDNINSIFARSGFDSLFGGVIVRASTPYSPIAIALLLSNGSSDDTRVFKTGNRHYRPNEVVYENCRYGHPP